MTLYSPGGEDTTAEVHVHTSSPVPRVKPHQVVDTYNSSMAQGHMLANSAARNYPLLSSAPHLYLHEPGTLNIPPRYPESSQCALHQHEHALGHYSYHPIAPAYLDDPRNDFHANPDLISGDDHPYRPRYPSIADATADTSYPPSFHTPFSSNLLHLPSSTYRLPPMTLHLPPEAQGIADYRDSMRAHHDLQSHNNPYRRAWYQSSLRLSHSVQDHNPPQDPRFYPDSQRIPQTGSPRTISTASDVLQDPPSQMQHRPQLQQQQNPGPPGYDSAIPSASYPGGSGINHRQSETTSATATYSAGSRSLHALFSIPMSIHQHSSYNKSSRNAHENNHTPQSQRDGLLGYSSRNLDTDIYSTSLVASDLNSLARFDSHLEARSRSTPDILRVPFPSRQPLSLLSPSLSPYHTPLDTSDNDSVADSDAVSPEDNEHEYHQQQQQQQQSASTSLLVKKKDGGANLKTKSWYYDSSGKRNMASRVDGARSAEDVVEKPPKKKKKSKMHDCAICGKQFPRPSGLKTHMNTHNKEKPFLCEFPGCIRTFGVRSNAKRHLRTHGITAIKSAGGVQPPYIVGFQPPVVLPPHLIPQENSNSSNNSASVGSLGGTVPTASENSDNVEAQSGAAGEGGNRYYEGEKDPQKQQRSKRRYKIKWMPQSLMSRGNAASLREVPEGGVEAETETDGLGRGLGTRCPPDGGPWRAGGGGGGGGAGTKEEGEKGTNQKQHVGEPNRPGLWLPREDDSKSDDTENVAMDDAGGMYSDMAAAARLNIPLLDLVPPSSSASGMDLLAAASLISRSQLSRECQCTPKCPSSSPGSTTCSSSSLLSLGLRSPESSATPSFVAPSSTSITPDLLLGTSPRATFEWKKSTTSGSQAVATSSTEFVVERNACLEYGSHPYHPSQFRGLPGPAATNAVVPPRYSVAALKI